MRTNLMSGPAHGVKWARTSFRAILVGVWVTALVACGGPGAENVAEPVEADWTTDLAGYRDSVGERFAFVCPPDGGPRSVWGTDVYTDDSSVCTAAVHAGEITFAEGGTVVVEIRGGEDSYEPSERNGVMARRYGAWHRSFVFP